MSEDAGRAGESFRPVTLRLSNWTIYFHNVSGP